MPQVPKPEIAARILDAALEAFARGGYAGTSMATIARRAGISTANLYRYHAGKEALFDAVVPDRIAEEHEALIAQRVGALSEAGPAEALLSFWVRHRLQVVILLDRAAGSRHEGYAERFVGQLVALGLQQLGARVPGGLTGADRLVLRVIFDNTRRAIVSILAACDDEAQLRHAIEAFWSYQLPGLQGFVERVVHGSTPQRPHAPSPADPPG